MKHQRVLVKEEQIKEKQKSFFDELFNGNNKDDWSNLVNPMEDGNHKFVLINRMTEVKDALWRMKMEKAIVPMKCQLKFGSARVMWVSAS